MEKKEKIIAGLNDSMTKEWNDTRKAFGHDIPTKIEIEPFSYPFVSETNARILREIRKKEAKAMRR